MSDQRANITLDTVLETLDAKYVTANPEHNLKVQSVCTSDLMSDVLAFSGSISLLLTGLTNPQVVRTAEMTDIRAICFVYGKIPAEDTIRLAEKNKITLMTCTHPLYVASGKVYSMGLPGSVR